MKNSRFVFLSSLLTVALACLNFLGCQSSQSLRSKFTPIVPKLEDNEIKSMINEVDADMAVNEDAVEADSQDEVVEEDLFDAKAQQEPSILAVPEKKPASELAYEINEDVEKWIRYFSEKDHERFQRFLDRGEKHRAVVEKTLKDNGLPKDLYYLALIESGYTTHARSHAGAVGIWQFIKGTAQRYGLRVDYYVDERLDPKRATEAGGHYLKDLHTVFQNWYLAMAAYNTGEMRVLGAIMRKNTRDYWQLVEQKALPRETRNYVPKFIAATIIGNHPERFGFKVEPYTETKDLQLVRVPGRVRLADVAKSINLSYKTMKKHNPHIRRGITPSGKDGYELWVPTNYVASLEKNYNSLLKKRVRRPAMVAEQPNIYKVKRGDSLSRIAQRFGVSVSYLKKVNKLRGSRIYVGKRLKVSTSSAGGHYARHRVRRGENLSGIARKFGTSVSKLKRINRLRNNTIYVGRVLKVPSDKVVTSHKVRRGESLIRIAKKYGISVAQLKRLNNLRRNRIYTGQVLKVKM